MPSSTIIAIGVCTIVGLIVFLIIFIIKFRRRGLDKEGDKMISIIQTSEAGLARIVSTGPKQQTAAQLEATKRAKNFRQRAKTETLRRTQMTSSVAPASLNNNPNNALPSSSLPPVSNSRRTSFDKENNLSVPEFIQKMRSRSISKDQAYDLVLPQFVDPEQGDVKQLMDQQDHSMDSKLEDEEEGIEVIRC